MRYIPRAWAVYVYLQTIAQVSFSRFQATEELLYELMSYRGLLT